MSILVPLTPVQPSANTESVIYTCQNHNSLTILNGLIINLVATNVGKSTDYIYISIAPTGTVTSNITMPVNGNISIPNFESTIKTLINQVIPSGSSMRVKSKFGNVVFTGSIQEQTQ